LLGFCCDEGVRRNGGRIGARDGPRAFRYEFFNLSFHNNATIGDVIYDAGNIICQDNALEEAQEKLGLYVEKIIRFGGKPIIVGGGHEIAYGHYLGIKEAGHRPAIVNFDAHFDLRETLEGDKGTSGTPFRQIEKILKEENTEFVYYCCGIQRFSNSRSLFEYAEKAGVNYRMASSINANPLDMSFIDAIIKKHKEVYITVCLDVFNASIAPGVSAPQVLGIDSVYVLEAISRLKASNRIISIDVAELNPARDLERKTARLAATIIAEYLYA